MIRRRLRIILMLAAVTSASSWAQEEARPIVRATLDPETPVTVGRPVRLTVEVLVPTWFTGAPRYPAIDVPDAIVIFQETGGFNFTDRIEGQTFAGQRRQYLIYPTRPGSLTITGEEVVMSHAVNARPSPPTPYAIPDTTIQAVVPPQAEGLGYFFAATDFSLATDLDRSTEELQVGDSLTRTMTMRAEDAFSMMLPPIDFESIEGLASYPEQPKLSDSGGERGEVRVARRIESVTYVMQNDGEYRLPEIEIYWWDSQQERMRQETVPEVAFSVAPNPSLTEEIPLPPEDVADSDEAQPSVMDWRDVLRRWAGPVAVMLAVVWVFARLLRRFLPRYRAWREDRRIHNAASEATYFERLKKACFSGNRATTFRQLMFWLDRYEPDSDVASLDDFTSSAKDPELTKRVEELSDALYSEKAGEIMGPWSGRRLFRRVARTRSTRQRHKVAKSSSKKSRLAPLNPNR